MSASESPTFRMETSNEIVALVQSGNIQAAIQKVTSLIDGGISDEDLTQYQHFVGQELIWSGESTFFAWFVACTRQFLQRPHIAKSAATGEPTASRLLYFFDTACRHGNIAVMELLVRRYGVDVNALFISDSICNSLDNAVLSERVEAVRWLLDNGVPPNLEWRGRTICPPILLAAYKGFTDICRLLVERGCLVNFLNANNMSPLDLAQLSGQPEVVAYLQSIGAQPGWQLRGESGPPAPYVPTYSAEHVAKWPEVGYCGELEADLVRTDQPLTIHLFGIDEEMLLVSDGMCEHPFSREPTDPEYCRAELLVALKEYSVFNRTDYAERMDEADKAVVEWMIRIARLPQEGGWLGPAIVLTNGDSPEPLWPGSPFTCILAVTPQDEPRLRWQRPDGTIVHFYYLMPLFDAERQYELAHGLEALLDRLREAGVAFHWLTERPCVV